MFAHSHCLFPSSIWKEETDEGCNTHRLVLFCDDGLWCWLCPPHLNDNKAAFLSAKSFTYWCVHCCFLIARCSLCLAVLKPVVDFFSCVFLSRGFSHCWRFIFSFPIFSPCTPVPRCQVSITEPKRFLLIQCLSSRTHDCRKRRSPANQWSYLHRILVGNGQAFDRAFFPLTPSRFPGPHVSIQTRPLWIQSQKIISNLKQIAANFFSVFWRVLWRKSYIQLHHVTRSAACSSTYCVLSYQPNNAVRGDLQKKLSRRIFALKIKSLCKVFLPIKGILSPSQEQNGNLVFQLSEVVEISKIFGQSNQDISLRFQVFG